MRKIFLLLSIVFFGLFFSCEKQTTVTETIEPPPVKTRYYLSFKVTCGKDNDPVWCSVDIYKNDEAHRLEGGGTFIQDGWFVSSSPYYLSTDNARIEIKKIPNGENLGGVFNISPTSDPIWFVEKLENARTNNPSSSGAGHMHLGSCN